MQVGLFHRVSRTQVSREANVQVLVLGWRDLNNVCVHINITLNVRAQANRMVASALSYM